MTLSWVEYFQSATILNTMQRWQSEQTLPDSRFARSLVAMRSGSQKTMAYSTSVESA